jgi:phage terminase Nu1 subunit (DNA packaging protein)
MENEITSAAMQHLLGIGKVALNDLSKRGIAVRGEKRGTYWPETITRYCEHLRAEAAARGGERGKEARERLAGAQASLAEAKAGQLRRELVEADQVERLWTTKMKAFRARILGIPQRVQYLSARQTVVLMQELRAALDELADEAG